LSQRDIDRDGQALLVQTIRTRLNVPTAQVMLERIVPIAETISFAPNQATLVPNQTQKLDAIAQLLQQYPALALEGVVNQSPTEAGTLSQERAQTILTYLQTQGKIQPERLTVNTATASSAIAELKTVVKSTQVLQEIAPN
jgi:outer membrane protein OmpA-like peptidoglycan-associated protein